MAAVSVLVGVMVIAAILLDVVETVLLPRRVTRRLWLAGLFQQISWGLWSSLGRRIQDDHRRESFLSFYGPLALVTLLVIWGAGLIFAFGLLQWGFGAALVAPEGAVNFWVVLYLSGTTFFTLGLGDVAPVSAIARALTVIEAGTGFALLALVIGYLPTFYGALSRREVAISLLDEWAGSPPSAGDLLLRLGHYNDIASVEPFLANWERWSAELLQIHLSYPWIAYYRSQHEDESWLSALTMVLDLSALVLVGIDTAPKGTAQRAFAMARHAAVDLSQILDAEPHPLEKDRLPASTLATLRATLAEVGVSLRSGADADRELCELRDLYEPYVNGLAHRLLMPLPSWLPAPDAIDDWRRTRWPDLS